MRSTDYFGTYQSMCEFGRGECHAAFRPRSEVVVKRNRATNGGEEGSD